ncbi:MAG: YigZ family protein [Paludibacter sp.]|nr:YigZ family protein [Paludibacter sp.]
MSDTFRTIASSSEGSYKEKGSKFLSFAFPVKNVDEINQILAQYRKQYYDARHICYAYMLGNAKNEWRANDDGEPSGTAGRPILGQINSFELTNVLVIVVRYFGGILLGTGGLITAYKEASRNALEQASIVEQTIDEIISIEFDYLLMNEVMRIVKEMSPQILDQSFDNMCAMKLAIRQSDAEKLKSKLENIIGVIIENN